MYKMYATFIVLAACVMGCSDSGHGSTSLPPQSVLFVGNSFTSANGGLDSLLTQLILSNDPSSQMFAAATTVDGATLKKLWGNSEARDMIRASAYEILVIQGDIPEGNVQTFNEYALKFVAEAKKAGTRPVLLMGWAYERLGWITQNEIAQAHYLTAAESGVDVAPVGLAWSRAIEERPELNLYAADREHPSLKGSYLTACVVYATVMNENPEGSTHRPGNGDITEEDARFLERIAWKTVQAYKGK